jgi:type II secretory pathway component GspD/PulD (secretin)
MLMPGFDLHEPVIGDRQSDFRGGEMRMNLKMNEIGWRNCARMLLGVAMALTGMVQGVWAQEAGEQKPSTVKTPATESTVTVYLKYTGPQQAANDLQTAVRNMVGSHTRVYYDSSVDAILLQGNGDELALAQKIIADLDRPRKVYRLEYTVEMMDGTKRMSAQHYALVAIVDQRATLKLGNRVPVVTGKMDADTDKASSQVQYVDVGLSISATLYGSEEGLTLQTKVEQSSLGEDKSGMGAQDPLLHQAVLENASTVTPGKAMTLGSMDIPGGTQRLEVTVVAEAVK